MINNFLLITNNKKYKNYLNWKHRIIYDIIFGLIFGVIVRDGKNYDTKRLNLM